MGLLELVRARLLSLGVIVTLGFSHAGIAGGERRREPRGAGLFF